MALFILELGLVLHHLLRDNQAGDGMDDNSEDKGTNNIFIFFLFFRSIPAGY